MQPLTQRRVRGKGGGGTTNRREKLISNHSNVHTCSARWLFDLAVVHQRTPWRILDAWIGHVPWEYKVHH